MSVEDKINSYLCEFIKKKRLYPPTAKDLDNPVMFDNYITKVCHKVADEIRNNNYMGARFSHFHNNSITNKVIEYIIVSGSTNIICNLYVYNTIVGWLRDEKIKNILQEC
jgi:hypothetical protein